MVTVQRPHAALHQCEICLEFRRLQSNVRRCDQCQIHQRWTERALQRADPEALRAALLHLVQDSPPSHTRWQGDPVVRAWHTGRQVTQVWRFLLRYQHHILFPPTEIATLARRHSQVFQTEGRRIQAFLPSPVIILSHGEQSLWRASVAVIILAHGEQTGQDFRNLGPETEV